MTGATLHGKLRPKPEMINGVFELHIMVRYVVITVPIKFRVR